MLRLPLLLVFVLILSACSSTTDRQITENYEAAKRYFEDPKIKHLQPDEFDIPMFDKHLMNIEHYIRANKLSTASDRIILRKYISEVRYLNYAKLTRNIPINKNQVNYAISLADTYRSLFSNSLYQELLFSISRIYAVVLEDTQTAQKYLLSCAKQGNAACTNIAAHNYLYGEDDFALDIDQAVYWSLKTAATGTDFGCAGVFSAQTLMWISRFHPEASTGKHWREWLEVAQSLSQESAQRYPSRVNATSNCRISDVYLAEYIFDRKEGIDNQEALKTSLAFRNTNNESNYDNVIRKISNDISPADLEKMLFSIKRDGEFCSAIHYFYLMANTQEDNTKSTLLRRMIRERNGGVCPRTEKELDRADRYF